MASSFVTIPTSANRIALPTHRDELLTVFKIVHYNPMHGQLSPQDRDIVFPFVKKAMEVVAGGADPCKTARELSKSLCSTIPLVKRFFQLPDAGTEKDPLKLIKKYELMYRGDQDILIFFMFMCGFTCAKSNATHGLEKYGFHGRLSGPWGIEPPYIALLCMYLARFATLEVDTTVFLGDDKVILTVAQNIAHIMNTLNGVKPNGTTSAVLGYQQDEGMIAACTLHGIVLPRGLAQVTLPTGTGRTWVVPTNYGFAEAMPSKNGWVEVTYPNGPWGDIVAGNPVAYTLPEGVDEPMGHGIVFDHTQV
jgi:hypothetical protein